MSAPTLAAIMDATAAVYGFSPADIRAGDMDVTSARLVFNWVARRLTRASHRQICEALGDSPLDTGRSVRRERRCADLLARDYDLRFEVSQVVARVCVAIVNRPLPAAEAGAPRLYATLAPQPAETRP